MGKIKDQGHRRDINTSENGCGAGQGTSAGYEITDGHCLSPPCLTLISHGTIHAGALVCEHLIATGVVIYGTTTT